MTRRRTARAIAPAVALAMVASTILEAATPPDPPRPGEGVLCLRFLTSLVARVGRQCPGKSDPAFQAVLGKSIASLDRYVAANGHPGTEGMARYAAAGQDKAGLCADDKLQLYDHFHDQGAAALEDNIRKAIARPGVPTWGECL